MSSNEHGFSTVVLVLLVAVVLAGLAVILLIVRHPSATPSTASNAVRPALNDEQKAYLSSLSFGDFHISAADNFLGNTVIYLDGKVTNQGAKPVRNLEVELNFVDTLNQVVLRETAYPLGSHATPLRPSETRAFRVTFEHMPVDWNLAPPKAKAVFVGF